MKVKIIGLCISVLFLGCKIEEVSVPAYLHIKPFLVNATASQGFGTEAITNGQVFVDGIFVGDYEFPITIPVAFSGEREVIIAPAVKENGISNPRAVYNLYKPFKQTLVLEKGNVDTLQPSTTYRDNVTFEWVETFDDNAISMSKGFNNQITDSMQTVPFTNSNALSMGTGFSAGVIFPLNSNGLTWEVVSNQTFLVPKKGKDVYMEMDIMSDINITVGIIYVSQGRFAQTEVVTIFPTEGRYKKFYLNLVTETSPLDDDLEVQIFIGGANFLGDDKQPKVFLDNIKLAFLGK